MHRVLLSEHAAHQLSTMRHRMFARDGRHFGTGPSRIVRITGSFDIDKVLRQGFITINDDSPHSTPLLNEATTLEDAPRPSQFQRYRITKTKNYRKENPLAKALAAAI